MSVGFLVLVAVVTAATALSLWPTRSDRGAAHGPNVVRFLLTMVVNEVPHLALLVLLASTAAAILDEDLLDSPAGWVVAGIVTLASVGLVVLAARSVRARGHVRRALVDGLGGQVEAARAASSTRAAAYRPWWWVLLTPLPLRGLRVRRVGNLAYGPERRQRLDVYTRRGRTAPGPTLVYLHGGGYFTGSKRREARALWHALARQGWTVISASYRLRPRADFTDHLLDAKSVLAWARTQGREHGVGDGPLMMAGSSAGGHLTALCALTANQPHLQPGFEDVDTSVDAAVCLCAYLGRYYGRGPDEQPASTPLAYDPAAAPPFLIVHGTADSYVPVEGARAMVDHLRSGSTRPVVYVELPAAQHSFDLLRSLRFQPVVEAVQTFARAVLPQPTAGCEAPEGCAEVASRISPTSSSITSSRATTPSSVPSSRTTRAR
jgi:acetyl esterase/lipase